MPVTVPRFFVTRGEDKSGINIRDHPTPPPDWGTPARDWRVSARNGKSRAARVRNGEETAAARIGAEDLFERRFAAARAAVARVEARVNASPRVIAANARQPPSDSDF